MYIYTCMYIYMCMYVYIHICAYIYTYICLYIYIYIGIYIYIHRSHMSRRLGKGWKFDMGVRGNFRMGTKITQCARAARQALTPCLFPDHGAARAAATHLRRGSPFWATVALPSLSLSFPINVTVLPGQDMIASLGYPRLFCNTASRMWVKHRSVVIVPPERDVESRCQLLNDSGRQ